METPVLDARLREVFTSVFDIPNGQFSLETSQDTLGQQWDSITHVMLILSLESAFRLQFDPDEARDLTSVKLIRLTLLERGVAQE